MRDWAGVDREPPDDRGADLRGAGHAIDLATLADMVAMPEVRQLPGVLVSTGGMVVFTLPRRFSWPLIQRGAIFLLITVVGLFPAAQYSVIAVAPWFTGPVTLVYLATYLWRGRFMTAVRADGIQVRGYFTRFVPWAHVASIRVQAYGPDSPVDTAYRSVGRRRGLVATSGRMARLAAAYVVRANGTQLLLRAPLVANWAHDPYFDIKIRLIRALMDRYSGGRPTGPVTA